MGDTSIVVDGYTFVFKDSDIESIEETPVSQSENTEIAQSGPMGGYNYDFNGAKKTIKITGQLTLAATTRVAGYSVTTILAQKQWLESMINGSQSPLELNDDFAGQSVYQKAGALAPYLASFTSTQAMVGIISFKRVRGESNWLPFSISLEVGI